LPTGRPIGNRSVLLPRIELRKTAGQALVEGVPVRIEASQGDRRGLCEGLIVLGARIVLREGGGQEREERDNARLDVMGSPSFRETTRSVRANSRPSMAQSFASSSRAGQPGRRPGQRVARGSVRTSSGASRSGRGRRTTCVRFCPGKDSGRSFARHRSAVRSRPGRAIAGAPRSRRSNLPRESSAPLPGAA
jgi:hypothetical protein